MMGGKRKGESGNWVPVVVGGRSWTEAVEGKKAGAGLTQGLTESENTFFTGLVGFQQGAGWGFACDLLLFFTKKQSNR